MATKINTITWDKWIRGLNTLQSPLNIRDDELSEALNVLLTDEGHPTKRPGTDNFGNTLNATRTPMLIPHYSKSGINNLLAVKDGFGLIRNDTTGAWATITSAASWPSSTRYNWAMINNITYISGDLDALTKFDGTYLTRFSTITTPTGLSIAKGASIASGQYLLSYKITAENNIGETAASSAVTVQVDRNRNQWNFDPTSPNANYSVTLSWSTVSGATKYNIYGVDSGGERYLDSVTAGLSYTDYGIKTPSVLFAAPTGNSTDAPRGEYIKTFKSSVFIAGDPTAPSRLYFSAGVDKPDSFTLSDGGGWIDINSNADDGVISGLGVFQDSLVAFKEYSIWKFDFTSSLLPSLGNIRQGLGCVSHKTIQPVENDMFFLGKSIGANPAIYTLGNEPNFLNVIRTNELSARVRPQLTSLVYATYKRAAAIYVNNKYHLFYTDGSGNFNNLALIYDRERLAFTRWDGLNVENPLVWRNSSNAERIIYGDGNDQRVAELSENFGDDKGVAISWEIRTKQERNRNPSIWERTKWVNTILSNVQGELTFKFYHDDVATDLNQIVQAQDDDTAFGYWQFGEGAQFGTTGTDATSSSSAIARRNFPIHQLGNNTVSNSFGFGIAGTGLTSNLILLSLSFERKEMSKNFRKIDDTYQI